MRRLLSACLVVATAFGCRQILGIESGVTDVPSDGLVDGDNVPDAGLCVTTSQECASPDVLRVCSTIGALPSDTSCAWGCALAPPHCAELEPRGGALVSSDLQPSPQFVQLALSTGHIIDTSSGRIGTAANPSSVRGAGNGVISGIEFQIRNGVGVFRVAGLTQSGATAVIGTNALAIATNGGVTLNGLIDLRGPCIGAGAGPGGFAGGAAQVTGPGAGGGLGGGVLAQNGGGGGGFGGVGGAGGGAPAIDNRFGNDEMSMLVGGGGGGGGGGADGAVGGGGGGAIQIASNGAVVIAAFAGINAGGCGGRAGTDTTGGGGGGGAGGAILIEARDVTVSGGLAVNGGGGGGTQTPGAAGRIDRLSALGGLAGGGGGGAGASLDGNGGGGSSAGGGGGVGRIRINTRTGLVPSTGVLSPGFSDPGTTATRGVAVVR